MREIKFRAWDKERKEMRDVKLMDWSDWWVSTGSTWERDRPLEYGERNSFKNEETDRHIIMQYTGLKDKNGKEIYEGDIVIITTEDEPYVIQGNGYLDVDIEKGFTAKGVVSFMYCSWFVTEDEKTGCPLDFGGDNSIEIIGNLYKNPELIQQK